MVKTYEEETEYLSGTIKKFNESLRLTDMRLEAIPRMYSDNPRVLYSMLTQYERRKVLLERTKDKPYFARIDFRFGEDGHEEECYIGKIGMYDDKEKILTVDWRAPISTTYYDSNVGETSFQGPKGAISGTLLLKRQYEIEDGKLISFQDVDTVSNDEILKPYLGANIDNRLKNIVATIQAEQNQIIREQLSKNMIIQGSAGSGKTTVALHRIAYLVYNYMANIKPDQFLVIGPNKFFVKYISSVLPELDVDNVDQLTYDEIVKRILGIDFTLLGDEHKLSMAIRHPKELFYEKLKVSMLFKSALDKFLLDFERTIIPTKDFQIKGYKILSADVIKDIYDRIEDDGALTFDNIAKRVDRAHVLLCKYIENHYESIMDGVRAEFYKLTSSMSKSDSEKESKKKEFVTKEVSNSCNVTLKDYFSASRPNILSLYLEFLKNIGSYINCEECDVTKNAATNASRLKKKELEFEDLASIIYLYYKVYGSGEFEKFRSTVIDEAQDLGPFNFFALKKLLQNSSFSVFGDLAQSIYPYRGIQSWEEVTKVFDGNCETKVLTKSYRTTIEIMTSANNLTRFMELPEAEPTIRHGDQVSYVETEKMPIEYMASLINKFKQKEYSSAAIICKDEEEATAINSKLKQVGVDVSNITSSDADYNGGVCTITCQLAKGLEFDGVIISDASEHIYSSERIGDMKLLYVAMTRPLHELHVLYSGEITKPLEADKKKLGNVARVKA